MAHAPSLKNLDSIEALPFRVAPYWNILEYCRHIGVEKREGRPIYWVARVRRRDGNYSQRRLGEKLTYDEAVRLAREWFASPEISAVASEAFPIGDVQRLKYNKQVRGFTVGDAMHDFVEWKRVSASKSYFASTLVQINYHIIPRIGDILVEDFKSRDLTRFSLDVLESSPKRGKQKPGPRKKLDHLSSEELRKRKKTLNALISILRLAFRLAWENGEIESQRAWRCLRRVPHSDTPRHYFLVREQCHRLLEACRLDLRRVVLGALYSGCRVSELARLQVRDVGGHFFGLYVAPMKSHRARYVRLPAEGMSFFLDESESKDPDEYVFRTQHGRTWIGGAHKHLFREAVLEAGLPEGFVFHGLRHTYASQLVQAGTPLAIVARQLGHSNTDTVSRTYGHLSCQSIDEELEQRFAPIDPRSDHDPRLDGITTSLQHQVAVGSDSWPQSNYSLRSDGVVEVIKAKEIAARCSLNR